jgi:hypothetical protein
MIVLYVLFLPLLSGQMWNTKCQTDNPDLYVDWKGWSEKVILDYPIQA